MSELTVKQLQGIANDPAAAWPQMEALLLALAGSEEQSQWAGEALENCGVPPGNVVGLIAPLTGHADELVAAWACKLLARCGESAKSAEPNLIESLSAYRPELVREEAARALGRVGATSVAARTALSAAARDGGPRLKRLATASLGG